jgi:hypothetical protein
MSGFSAGPTPFGWNTGQQYYDEGVAQANAAGAQQYRQLQLRGQQEKAIADQQAALQREALAQKGSQFGAIFGQLGGLLGQAQSGAYGVGGTNTPTPTISAAPVWSDQMINQQANESTAGLLQGAQSQQQALAQKYAGMGFGRASPGLLAQQSNLAAQARGAATGAANAIRWNAAQGNAAQVLKGQTAQQQQWQDVNQADIERRKTATGLLGSLAGSLSGLI